MGALQRKTHREHDGGRNRGAAFLLSFGGVVERDIFFSGSGAAHAHVGFGIVCYPAGGQTLAGAVQITALRHRDGDGRMERGCRSGRHAAARCTLASRRTTSNTGTPVIVDYPASEKCAWPLDFSPACNAATKSRCIMCAVTG